MRTFRLNKSEIIIVACLLILFGILVYPRANKRPAYDRKLSNNEERQDVASQTSAGVRVQDPTPTVELRNDGQLASPTEKTFIDDEQTEEISEQYNPDDPGEFESEAMIQENAEQTGLDNVENGIGDSRYDQPNENHQDSEKNRRYAELKQQLERLRIECASENQNVNETTKIIGPGIDLTVRRIGNTTEIFGPGVDITAVTSGNKTRITGPGVDMTAVKIGNTTRITGPGVDLTSVTEGNRTRTFGPGVDITLTIDGNTAMIVGPGVLASLVTDGQTTLISGPGLAALAVTSKPNLVESACVKIHEIQLEMETIRNLYR